MSRRTTPRTLRSRVALAAALACGATTLAGAAPTVAVTLAPGLQVPNTAVIVIDGRGYGHGHGLSQYGAEGAARQGLSAHQIVRFYYPHTGSGTANAPVNVLITADTDNNTTVLTRPGLAVHDPGDGSTTAVPTSGKIGQATRWRLSSGSNGTTKLSYLTDAWHVSKRLHGDGEFRAPGALTLVAGSQKVTYRGRLESRTPASGPADRRITVNRLPLDDYVRGVIPREMPASWHRAAVRAQAIAARTYAAFESANSTNRIYQLCDTSACQVYGGKTAEYPSTNDAVVKTADQIRTYGGDPAFTQFSASDGGWTSDGGQPYLIAQKDPYDGWSGNLVHRWTTSVTSRTIEKKWPALGNLQAIQVNSRAGYGQWNGRVETMTLHGSTHDVVVSGDTFRAVLGLRSTWFDLASAHQG